MKFKCADLDWQGACRDFSPSYDESRSGYEARDSACVEFAEDDDIEAYLENKCKRYAHVYVPGGRSKQRYEDQVVPGTLIDRTQSRLASIAPDWSRRTQASEGLRRSYDEEMARARQNPRAPHLEEQIQEGLTRYFKRFHADAEWPFVNIQLEFPDTVGPLIEAGIPTDVAALLVKKRRGRWARLTPQPQLVSSAKSRWTEVFKPVRFVQGLILKAESRDRGPRDWFTLVTLYGRTATDTDPKSEIIFRRSQLEKMGSNFEKDRLFGTLGDLGLTWVNYVERKDPETQRKIIQRVPLQIGGFYVIREERRPVKMTSGIRPVPAEETSPLEGFLRVGDVFESLEVLPEPETEAAFYGQNQVASQEEWRKILRTIEPGVTVRLTVRRENQRITVDVPIVKGQKDEDARLSEDDIKDYVSYLFDRIEEKAREESLVEMQLAFADEEAALRVAAPGQILSKDKIIREVVIPLSNREHSKFSTPEGRTDITDYRTLKDVPFEFFPRVLAGMVRKKRNRKVQRELPVLPNPVTRKRSVDPQEYFMSRAAHNPDDAVIARAHQLVEAGEHDLGTALADAWSEIHQGARANPRRRRGAKTAAQRAAQAKAKRVLAYAAQLRRKNRRLSAKAACDQAWAHFSKAAPRRSRRNPYEEDTTMVRSSLSRAVDFSDPSMVRSALMNPYEEDTTMVRSALSRPVDFSDSTMVRTALMNPHYSDYSEHHPVYEQEIGQFSTGEAFTHGIQPMNRRNPRKARKNVGAYELDADYADHHPVYEQFDGQFSTGEAWSHGIQPVNRRNPSSIAEAFSNPDEESALQNPRKRKAGSKRKASPQAKRAMQLVHERGISLAEAWEIVKSGRGGAGKAKKAAPKSSRKSSRKSARRSRRNPSCMICHQPIEGEVYGAEPYAAHKHCV